MTCCFSVNTHTRASASLPTMSAFKHTPQESQASAKLQMDVTNKTDVAENAFRSLPDETTRRARTRAAGEIPLNNRTSKAQLDRSARCDGVREAEKKLFSSMNTDVAFNCTNLAALSHRDK